MLFELALVLLITAHAPEQVRGSSPVDPSEVDRISLFQSYLALAHSGDPDAQQLVGSFYEDGYGVLADMSEALKWYKLAAEDGHRPLAEFRIGSIYYDGRGVETDKHEALRWYTLAAQHGGLDARAKVGHMYFRGDGVAENWSEAFKWLELLAEKGDASAQQALGDMYRLGQGVELSEAEAIKWYRLAADQGSAWAQYWLGYLIEDKRESFKWLKLAAGQGDVDAQAGIGAMYLWGVGVPENFREAQSWSRRAAEQGSALAQKSLGIIFSEGLGVPKDFAEAYVWLSLASAQDVDTAVLRDSVKARLTPKALAQAQARASSLLEELERRSGAAGVLEREIQQLEEEIENVKEIRRLESQLAAARAITGPEPSQAGSPGTGPTPAQLTEQIRELVASTELKHLQERLASARHALAEVREADARRAGVALDSREFDEDARSAPPSDSSQLGADGTAGELQSGRSPLKELLAKHRLETPAAGPSYLAHATSALKLRQGPGQEFQDVGLITPGEAVFVTSLEGRNEYVEVIRIQTNEEGWVHQGYLDIDSEIPRSASPAFTAVGRIPGSNPEVEIWNNSQRTLTVVLSESRYSLEPQERRTLSLRPGVYSCRGSAPGVIPYLGSERFESNTAYTWQFYIETNTDGGL